MKPLNPRHRLLVHMCPDVPCIIDVGADHGYVAERLGAIASERMPHRRGTTPVPWVVADGLKPYKRADAAIIAGMGASKIIDIVSHAPEIPTLILHATDNQPNYDGIWRPIIGVSVMNNSHPKQMPMLKSCVLLVAKNSQRPLFGFWARSPRSNSPMHTSTLCTNGHTGTAYAVGQKHTIARGLMMRHNESRFWTQFFKEMRRSPRNLCDFFIVRPRRSMYRTVLSCTHYGTYHAITSR